MRKLCTARHTNYILRTLHGPENTSPKETLLMWHVERRRSSSHMDGKRRWSKWRLLLHEGDVRILTPLFRYERNKASAILGGWNHYLMWRPYERYLIRRNLKKARDDERIEKKLDNHAQILHQNDPYNKYD